MRRSCDSWRTSSRTLECLALIRALPGLARSLLVLVAATLPGGAFSQNVAIPSSYNEPGYTSTRDFADASGTETIDPYTGQLHVHYRDLVVPGNGGLDIVVNRTYHSPTKQNNPYQYLSGQTATGLGWDINFGRIWPGPNIAFFSNVSNPNRTTCRLSGTNVNSNPVLELPDGSRHVLVSTPSGVSTHAYVTADQWIAKCLMSSDYSGGAGDGQTPDGGLLVVSPEGVRYYFDRYRRVADGSGMQAYHPTRIVHPNGTELTFTYRAGYSGQVGGAVAQGDFAMINTITGSESRSVTFNYVNQPGTSNWIKPRLTSIVLNGSPSRTWTYNYAFQPAISGQPAVEILDSVVRPGGSTIDFEYYTGATEPHRNALKWIDMPGGGRVRYEYDTEVFANRDATNQTLIVVSKKVNEGSISPGGTWQYDYIPAGSSGTEDETRVTDPEGCTQYKHRTARSGAMWEEGALLSVKRYAAACSGSALRTETYTWESMTVSSAQGRWRPPAFSEGAPYLAPILSLKSTVQDGSTYSIDYSNFDSFGNPRQVAESSPQGSRTTDLTYFSDPSNLWIKRRVETETVRSAGVVAGANVDATVSRDFNASNGNLNSQTRYGVTTSYQYHSSGSSRGEVSRITDANGNVTILDDYKRGIPQLEKRKVSSADPDSSLNNIEISRVVNNTGTVASETNGRQKTTAYGYDSLELLTSITTPKTTDSDISVGYSFTGSGITRALTRGNFRETRTFDGLGRIGRIESRDLSSGVAITQFIDYDALGRRTKSYNPTYGSTKPAQYFESSYDDLDRVTAVYNPYPVGQSTRTSIAFGYQTSNVVVRTDERGWQVTSKYRSYGDPAARELVETTGPTAGGQPQAQAYRETKIERTKIGTVTRIQQGGAGDFLGRDFVHDYRFLPDREIHPETGTTELSTDAVGNITGRQVGSAAAVTYQYDGLNRLDYVDFSGSSATPSADVDYVYNRNSNIDNVIKGATSWAYLYDDNDNLEYETLTVAGSSYQIHYYYNALDVLERIVYPDGLDVSYVPDNLGRPTRVGSYVTNIAYHANGQVQSITYANGHIETVGQNEKLLPTAFQVGRSGFSRIVDRLYGYDGAGNVDTLTDYANSGNNRSMGYDGWNEITAGNGPWGSGSFSYDVRGNLRTRNLGLLGNLTLNYSPTTNRLDNVNGSQYSYDVYGNVTSRQAGGRIFDYDDASDMTRARSFGSLPQVDYTYDGLGKRSRELIAGSLDRRAFYSTRGMKLYERETVNGEEIDYVYLGSRLVTSRSHCYLTTDSDSDGIPNCVEARSGLSPNSAGDAAVDSDGDGLTNLQEYQAGTGFTNSDTDRDGLSDSYEVRYGLGALTSNASADTDGDSLTNLQEFQLGTNPTDTDTDNDGIPDAQDPKPKFNPAILIPILQIILGN